MGLLLRLRVNFPKHSNLLSNNEGNSKVVKAALIRYFGNDNCSLRDQRWPTRTIN